MLPSVPKCTDTDLGPIEEPGVVRVTWSKDKMDVAMTPRGLQNQEADGKEAASAWRS